MPSPGRAIFTSGASPASSSSSSSPSSHPSVSTRTGSSPGSGNASACKGGGGSAKHPGVLHTSAPYGAPASHPRRVQPRVRQHQRLKGGGHQPRTLLTASLGKSGKRGSTMVPTSQHCHWRERVSALPLSHTNSSSPPLNPTPTVTGRRRGVGGGGGGGGRRGCSILQHPAECRQDILAGTNRDVTGGECVPCGWQ